MQLYSAQRRCRHVAFLVYLYICRVSALQYIANSHHKNQNVNPCVMKLPIVIMCCAACLAAFDAGGVGADGDRVLKKSSDL